MLFYRHFQFSWKKNNHSDQSNALECCHKFILFPHHKMNSYVTSTTPCRCSSLFRAGFECLSYAQLQLQRYRVLEQCYSIDKGCVCSNSRMWRFLFLYQLLLHPLPQGKPTEVFIPTEGISSTQTAIRCNNSQAIFIFPYYILPIFLQASKTSNSTGRQSKKTQPGRKKQQQQNFYCASVQGEHLSNFQEDQKIFLKKKMKYGHRKEKSCLTCPKKS